MGIYCARTVLVMGIDVEADNPDDAIDKAKAYLSTYDFGRARDVYWGVEYVESVTNDIETKVD